MNTIFSRAQSDAYLTQVLLRSQQQGALLSSPYRLPALISSQTWPPERPCDMVAVHTSQASHSSNNVTRELTPNEGREESFLPSDLGDDEFFRQYVCNKFGEKANKNNESFPLKLYRIIYEAEKNGNQDIISFCPSGRSFMIHSVDDFVKKIMPKYFVSSRMASFQRQLNLYGFRRRFRGNDKGGFFHESFLRGDRNLCLTIRRKAQNFKVPPYLLTQDRASHAATPTATPAMTPPTSGMASPTPIVADTSPSASNKFMLGSSTFPFHPRPDNMSCLQETPSYKARLSLQESVHTPGLPLIPGLGNSRAMTTNRPPIAPQPPCVTSTELLKLNHQLLLAKETTAMKQQLVMAAIERLRLLNRVEFSH